MNSLSPTLTPTKYTNEHRDNSVTPKLKRKLSNPISQKLAIIYDIPMQINMIIRHLITVLKKIHAQEIESLNEALKLSKIKLQLQRK